jgi:glucokinase
VDQGQTVPESPARAPWVLGADLGGTKIVAGLVDPEDRIRARDRRAVPASRGSEAVLESVAQSLEACCRAGSAAPLAVGIGVAAQVDPGTGVVHHAPNLGWRDYAFGRRLSERLHLPVVAANDVRTITLGEWNFGAGRGSRNFLCVFVGTGIGGGAVVDGHLLDGHRHAAAELGHSLFVAGGRKCHCPNHGCFEAYLSGWAIEERVREAAQKQPRAGRKVVKIAGGVGKIRPVHLERAAKAGDPFATRFVERLAREFADAIVGLVNAFNPDRVVVGGKITEGFHRFVPAAQEAVRTRCQPPASGAEVVASTLGADAGILGAAILARDRLKWMETE